MMMELEDFYVDMTRWEEEFGLPRDTFAEWKLEDSNQEESAFGHVSEGTSVLKDDYDPLKESDNQSFSFETENDSLQNDWLDVRADIGAMLNDFIKSGNFDDVLNVMEESEGCTKNFEIEVDEPTEVSEIPEESWYESIPNTEVMSDSNVEIDDEINLQNTCIIYVDDSKSCEGLPPLNDQIHDLAVTDLQLDGADVSSSTIDNKDEFTHFNDILGTQTTEVTSIELPKEDATFMEIPSTSGLCNLKSKRGRKKIRVEPYEKNNCSSISSGDSTCSSFPGSPSSETSYESESQSHPPTTKRKERKKHQNRNAATKYRQKKRAEQEKIGSEEKDLEFKNKELKQKFESLSTEIAYLKGLMREILTARGMLKK
ncbi:hypothetical protein CHUAL_011831 [Chamberlinius hualienensis]